MNLPTKSLAALASVFVGASQGSFEVVKSSSAPDIVSVLVVLTTVTSLTFIMLLLACGTRKPWI